MNDDPAVPADANATETQALNRVVDALTSEFPSIARDVINSRVREAFRLFDGAPIREFVPVLVERQVRTVLAASP